VPDSSFIIHHFILMTNILIISAAKQLYLQHNGRNHRAIEREMRALGCLTFSRRRLYNRMTPRGLRPGWIEKYGWKNDLAKTRSIENGELRIENDKPSGADLQSPKVTNNIAQGKAGGRHPGNTARNGALPEGEQQAVESQNAPASFQDWLTRISPGMTWNWKYQKIIYRELERVTRGECKRLMIFLPPRHGKSELVTNRYTAWRLQQNPQLNVILGSYNQRLANRFSRKVRITFEDALSEPPTGVPAAASASGLAKSAGGQFAGQKRSKQDRQDEQDSSSQTNERYPDHLVHPVRSSPQPSQPSPISAAQTMSRARLNTVAEWETGLGGGVRAVGVGGGITGFGADLVIIDDPIKSRAEAESKTYRERVWDWFNDDLYTRLEPNAAIILIQTRWHENDLAGRLLKDMEDGGEHWNVISLSAIAEAAPIENGELRIENEKPGSEKTILHSPFSFINCSEGEQQPHIDKPILNSPFSILHSDPLGRAPGEPFCPARFTVEDLLRIKKKLGTYSFSALYQQRPTPPEGGLFKREWFKRIVDRPPEGLRWCRGYDLAVSTNTNADYTASFRCALDKKTGDLYIANGFHKRIEFPEQRRYIVDRIKSERDTEHGIEQALHGQAFIQELRREHRLFGRAFRGVKVTADKFTRVLAWANLAEEGKVILVRGPWIDGFLEEVCTFPNSTHDDQLDAVSIAVEMLERQKHVAYGF
jgi:predicted phage terminase large subunit-like protein